MISDTRWTEKYRPKTINDCVLPSNIKEVFLGILKNRDVPNMFLVGRPGMGKTTVAKALCNELGCDTMFINASKQSGIDTLRNEIETFASTISLSGESQKVLIWDEGDNLSYASQTASRSFFEEYSRNCRFIITGNFKKKIIEPLLSRLDVVEFTIPTKEKQEIAKQILKRIFFILDSENVEYDKKVIGALVVKYFPDFRKTISVIQKYYYTCGKIDVGLLSMSPEGSIKDLMTILKEKDFPKLRLWVHENVNNDFDWIARSLFDSLETHLEPSSIPQAILTLADYSYKSGFVADQEINLTAMLIELMAHCVFKR